MSNTFFRFKQFTIHQDRSAMKVSTDACIAGAWTKVPGNAKRILDIGTGTGLLALMLAQKSNKTIIDAVEDDEQAAKQAKENVQLSPWKERINIICADATVYGYKHRYSLVIANPPFFNNSLLGDSDKRNRARHTLNLSYESLLRIISDNLAEEGVASVLLPFSEFMRWEKLVLENNWKITHKLLVHPSEDKAPNRVVSIIARTIDTPVVQEHLFIRDKNGRYTAAYNSLMYPYYLDQG